MRPRATTKFRLLMLSVAWLPAACASSGPSSSIQAANDPAALERVADRALIGGDADAAVAFYGKALSASGNDWHIQLKLANAWFRKGDLGHAAEQYRAVAAREPDSIDAHLGLGRIFLASHDSTSAMNEFGIVLGSDPANVKALNGRGIALDYLGRHADAQASYRAALLKMPEDNSVRNNLGLSLSLSGQSSEAIRLLSAVAESPAATPRNRQNLALALGLDGAEEQARTVSAADLDQASVAKNLKFYAEMRVAVATASKAPANAGS